MQLSLGCACQVLGRKRKAREMELTAALQGACEPGFESVSNALSARPCTHDMTACMPLLRAKQGCASPSL